MLGHLVRTLTILAVPVLATPAFAHPHVFVDAKADVVFDTAGKVTAIRQVWRFDDGYSAFASQGLDANGDGTFSVEELQPLADLNVESLKEFGYFTFLAAGDRDVDFAAPTEYWIQSDGGLLTLYFTLPTTSPVEIRSLPAQLEVYDPTFFVSFVFVEDNPVTLVNAPAGCGSDVIRPKELDPSIAATLADIPADQREIPAELQLFTEELSNGADLKCP
jgi:ABC-type uncharacterized transport system substrate-binding protein